jgi:epoxyqueuosine reductase QueG
LKDVLSIRTDTDYKLRFRGSAILRAKREQLLRNACFVTANLKAIELLGDLKEISTSDPSELVRNSAVRAIKRLSAD